MNITNSFSTFLRRTALPLLALVALAQFFGGCGSDCTYPDQRPITVRFINSMVDFPKVSLFINGKLFKSDFPYDPPTTLGYVSTYADGSLLPAGDSVLFVLTSDAAGKDTLIRQFISLDFHIQTVVAMGMGKPILKSDKKTAKFLRLVDNDVPPNPSILQMKFAHAIPDLPSLDIYFKTELVASDVPFATIKYGEATPRFDVNPDDIKGLTVTEAGNKSNIIIEIPHSFFQSGFFITILIRGSSKPVGSQPVATPLVLADGRFGNFILDFGTFGVRFVNGMRNQQLSLLTQNMPPYTSSNAPDPRSNVPGQKPVLDVQSDSITAYFGVGVSARGNTNWFFSRDNYNDTIHSFHHIAKRNERWTMVALETSTATVDRVVMQDTMTYPGDTNMARIRIVNLSPDHPTISFTLGGKTVTMAQKDVQFFTVPVGQVQINFADGATMRTHTLNIKPGSRPLSLFILPDKATTKFPVTMTDQ